VRAVDEQIEIFQNNRSNKRGTAFGFDRRSVRSLASQDFEVNALHSIPLGGSSVGIAHLDFAAALQTKLLYG